MHIAPIKANPVKMFLTHLPESTGQRRETKSSISTWKSRKTASARKISNLYLHWIQHIKNVSLLPSTNLDDTISLKSLDQSELERKKEVGRIHRCIIYSSIYIGRDVKQSLMKLFQNLENPSSERVPVMKMCVSGLCPHDCGTRRFTSHDIIIRVIISLSNTTKSW